MKTEMKLIPKRYLRRASVALAAALLLTVLTACYAPLGVESTGGLAINMTLPGSIFAQSTQSYVARTLVVNRAYEQQLRRAIAIGMFIDENEDVVNKDVAGMRKLFDDLEDESEQLLIDLILRATVKFGGKYYFDIPITADISVEGGTGEVLIPGIPAGREYIVYFEMYLPGQQDDEDSDPVAESRIWEDDPEDGLFGGTNPGQLGPGSTLAQANIALQAVLDAYSASNAPFVLGIHSPVVFVEEGRTSELSLLVDVEGGGT